jgi:integrase
VPLPAAPEQLPSLIDAADSYLRPVLATLAGAGLRPGEAVVLDWRDVSLPTGTLTVGRAKTGRRLLPGGRSICRPRLVEALTEWRAFKPGLGAPPCSLLAAAGGRQ